MINYVIEFFVVSFIAFSYSFFVISRARGYFVKRRLDALKKMNDYMDFILSDGELDELRESFFLIVSMSVLDKKMAKSFIKLCEESYDKNRRRCENVNEEKLGKLEKEQRRIILENGFIFSALALAYSTIQRPWRAEKKIRMLKKSVTVTVKHKREQNVYRIKPTPAFLSGSISHILSAA